MSLEIKLLITLGILFIICLFVIRNLLIKYENLEDIIVLQDTFISNLHIDIVKIINRLNEIDSRGAFKSDDEIGWFWDEMIKLKDILHQNENILQNSTNDVKNKEKKKTKE